MGKTLCLVIDPGHYPGYNPGVNPNYKEGDAMWKLANYEKAYCDAYYSSSVDCVLTRSQNQDPALESGRGNVAVNMKRSGKYNVVVFMSDHSNAPGGNPASMSAQELQNYRNISGSCIFTSLYRKNTDDLTVNLASTVSQLMGSKFNYLDRQVLSASDSADWWGVVRGAMGHAKTQAQADSIGVADVAFIIEHGFHTNPRECAWLMNDNNLERLAQVKIDFICSYFGIQKQSSSVISGSPSIKSVEIINGTVKVVYPGADGVNIRSSASYNANNVIGTLKLNDVRRVINKVWLTDGTTMYMMEDGNFISTHGKYVTYTSNLGKGFKQKVKAANKNNVQVRFAPLSKSASVTHLNNGNLFDVVEEAYNGEGHWYMVHIKNNTIDTYGYVKDSDTK